MSEHRAKLIWSHDGSDFLARNYTRNHRIEFPNGQSYAGSAAVEYGGDAACVDPEAAFTASLSSCHMLTFLALAAVKGFVVEHYEDDAVGTLGKNEQGRLAMTHVRLSPQIRFAGNAPDADTLKVLHERAHRACFIANSVSTIVEVA
ncbi:MAG: OsmC family protein [Xanthomonadales bacterium]|nr:OsmC family protein [Xanthomonadales bacterium]